MVGDIIVRREAVKLERSFDSPINFPTIYDIRHEGGDIIVKSQGESRRRDWTSLTG